MQQKEGKEEVAQKTNFVKWFSEIDKNSGNIAGGKGANLGEISHTDIPVPPGFVITAQAYDYFIKESKLKNKIDSILSKIDYENTSELNAATEQIRKLITDSQMPKEMEEDIIESYEALDVGRFDSAKDSALDILKNSAEPIFVAVRSSATTEDLADASFAGQQDTFLNVKGNAQLLSNIKKCFASLYTSRATYYRNKKGFTNDQAKLAVVVQKMIDSSKSGVVFSKDPTMNSKNIIMEAVFGLGEGIVSGKITPDKYVLSRELEIIDKKIADKKIALTRTSGGDKREINLRPEKSTSQVLNNYEIKRIGDYALKLEEHYQKPQDIEFAIEGEEIFIVQTRPITTLKKKDEKSESEVKISGKEILSGLGASPGIASGKVKIIQNMSDLSKIQQRDVLVTGMTNPDMVVSMQKCSAIITDEGGMTAHAAIVSREMGIPAVVGTEKATSTLQDGNVVTVDGTTGKIYSGKTAETKTKEVLPVTAKTKTKIKVIVDLPSFAERASKTELKEVGLLRLEGIVAESGKHPKYFLDNNKISEYEDIIFEGINKIASYFDELWVRTSDIRTDEFQNLEGAPKEIEANPMLGMHGIRYGLKHPEILKAELKALKRISEKGKRVGIMTPQLIKVEEIQKVKKILKEIEFFKLKIGVMIETPASVQIIKSLCEEGIDFISFGTNDLTQYILAIDRGNEELQDIYDEMNPAVLYQLEYVIRVAKRSNVETSICGQAGSKKEMVKYLIEKGIDSISVNADAASEIAQYVEDLENDKVKGTDKEPRKYQPEKNRDIPKEEKEISSISDKSEDEIKKDIEAIEKERKESEDVEKFVKEDKTEGDMENDKIEENVEKAVKAIEDEKKECIESGECEVEKDEEDISKDNEEFLEPTLEEDNSDEKSKDLDIY